MLSVCIDFFDGGIDWSCEFRQRDLKSMLYWKTNTRLLAKFHKVSMVVDT
jgi:hypothetical protein